MEAGIRLGLSLVAVVSAGCGGRVGDATEESVNGNSSSGGAFMTTIASGGAATTSTDSGGAESGGAESGGAESGGAPVVCPMTSCGGVAIGNWTVSGSCFESSGTLDVSILGLGCTTVLAEAMTIYVSGRWIANADGTFADNTTTTFEGMLALPASCLDIAGTATTCVRIGSVLSALGFTSCSCHNSSSGGCECAVGAIQRASMGVLAIAPVTWGKYWTSLQILSMGEGVDTTSYAFCASEQQLRVSPHSGALRVPGTITLIRD